MAIWFGTVVLPMAPLSVILRTSRYQAMVLPTKQLLCEPSIRHYFLVGTQDPKVEAVLYLSQQGWTCNGGWFAERRGRFSL